MTFEYYPNTDFNTSSANWALFEPLIEMDVFDYRDLFLKRTV